jgi:hypothetical protein
MVVLWYKIKTWPSNLLTADPANSKIVLRQLSQMKGELHTSRQYLRPMYDHHALSHGSTGHVFECQCNGLSSYRRRDISALALHGLDDRRGVGTVRIWSKEHRVAFLDGATVEQAIHDRADIRHRPDICHRELFEFIGSRRRGK